MTRYEQLLSDINEIISVFRDMEGGLFILAILAEILTDLLGVNDSDGCLMIIQKLYEVTSVPMDEECTNEDALLFVEILADSLEEYS